MSITLDLGAKFDSIKKSIKISFPFEFKMILKIAVNFITEWNCNLVRHSY